MFLDHRYHDAIEEFTKRKESLILEELNDLISRGLLVVEETRPVMTRSPIADKIEITQGVRLVLKDQEYISKLEAENKELKEKLDKHTEAINTYVGIMKSLAERRDE